MFQLGLIHFPNDLVWMNLIVVFVHEIVLARHTAFMFNVEGID